MAILGRWETIYQAARIIRHATGHDEFTVSDLRHHMDYDKYEPKTEHGTVYVDAAYVEKLLYKMGLANY